MSESAEHPLPPEKKDHIELDYPSNSHKAREEAAKPAKVKVEKIIEGKVVQRKKPLGKKIAETFNGDDMQSVGNYILFDVVIPAAKDMVADIVTQGIQRKLYGDARRGSSGSGKPGGYTSYNRMYSGSSSSTSYGSKPDKPSVSTSRVKRDFNDIVLESRGDAEGVIDGLTELISQFGMASVADLYDIVGETGDFTDVKWGWTNLRDASVRRIREGYLVVLPRPSQLD